MLYDACRRTLVVIDRIYVLLRRFKYRGPPSFATQVMIPARLSNYPTYFWYDSSSSCIYMKLTNTPFCSSKIETYTRTSADKPQPSLKVFTQ